ncbi:MAG: hypothetical protein SV377_08050 [Halobacteria archaeon]|nr:hypothetical protein [Halobacteria archaeon]
MSTVQETKYNQKQRELIEYLEEEIKSGKVFFKSKFISQDLDMTAKEVGANMLDIAERYNGLSIEKWTNNSPTTWKVEPPVRNGSTDATREVVKGD